MPMKLDFKNLKCYMKAGLAGSFYVNQQILYRKTANACLTVNY